MYIGIATKMLVGSLGAFLLIRIIGKKAVSELTPFDLIYIIVLGSLVEGPLFDEQINVLHILFAIIVWGTVVYIIEKILERTDKLSSIVQGEPSILIEKGKLNLQEINRNHFDMEQLRTMLREQNCYSIAEAYYAILEVNGSLTVITKDEKVIPTFLLIEEGNIKYKTLNGLNKTEGWLRTELDELGYTEIEEITYCEWDENKQRLLVDTYNNAFSKTISIDD